MAAAAYNAYWLQRCSLRPRKWTFGQVPLTQAFVHEPIRAGWGREFQRCHRQLQDGFVRGEPVRHLGQRRGCGEVIESFAAHDGREDGELSALSDEEAN